MNYRRLRALLIALPILLTGAPTFAEEPKRLPLTDYTNIGNFDYVGAQIYSKYLLSRFKPSENIFVGIGGSPTTVVAYLKAHARVIDPSITAFNIPFSNRDSNLLYTDHPEIFGRYFRTVFPEEMLRTGKRLILIDYSNSGNTIKNAMRLIAGFLHTEGYKNPLHGLAMVGNDAWIGEPWPIDEISLPAGIAIELYDKMHYRDVREYPSFSIRQLIETKEIPAFETSAAYAKLVAEWSERVAKDPCAVLAFDPAVFDPKQPGNCQMPYLKSRPITENMNCDLMLMKAGW